MARILVVEDEAKVARFVELELMHEGYEVDKAADGRSGVEAALAHDYDLVLLDVLLPQLSGSEMIDPHHRYACELTEDDACDARFACDGDVTLIKQSLRIIVQNAAK